MWEKYQQPNSQLEKVHYEIRGPLLQAAMQLEEAGHHIIKLNIGNPAAFGFEAPALFTERMKQAAEQFHGYCDSKGHLSARKAILAYNQQLGISPDNHDLNRIYLGNGVSELIMISARALCDVDSEILIPSPDYPLWTAAINLAGGKAVHYGCIEDNGWQPDLVDLESKINANTKAIVVINPNNPTGAVYSKEILEQIVAIARKHGLMILSDEIYDRIVYDQAKHISIASLAPDVLCITYNGASKANRLCGYRIGWMHLSGPFEQAQGFIAGLEKLTSMRLCSVSPFQDLVASSLFEDKSIYELVAPQGRLYEQRTLCVEQINQIPGLSCNPVAGSLYAFVKIDLEQFNFVDDLDFATKLLVEEHVLVIHGQGFNAFDKQHFRIVFLPDVNELGEAIKRIARLCERYRKV